MSSSAPPHPPVAAESVAPTSVFLTGATGFLGRQLLARLLGEGHEVIALARDRDVATARARLVAALATVGGPDGAPIDAAARAGRLVVALGDLDRPGLGLGDADRERVLASVTDMVHCGASVRFDLPLDRARAVNVDGTRALLDLARARQARGPLRRIDYVGTAYVAGRREDLVLERELDGAAGHRNTYERTKFEAEQLVRLAARELPIAIHRPSIVVGEAGSGHTSSFKMIYWPARVYASGLWRIVPGREATPIDLVPVDFVADAIVALRRQPATLGRAFHLAAGDGALTMGQVADLLVELFPRRRRARFVDPGWWMRWVHPLLATFAVGPTRRVIRTGQHYVPYFSANPRFDTREAEERLALAGLAVPRAASYVRTLFEYCIESDWGRRELPRPAVRRAA